MNDWLHSFNNPAFMPHGHCYLWRSDILWTHLLADLATGTSYVLISIILVVLVYKRKNSLPFKEIFALFITFIFCCGLTHFVSIYTIWNPVYAFEGWLKALTAFVSVLTVIVLVPKLPLLMSLPGIYAAHQKSLAEIEELKQANEGMSSVFTATLDREKRIIELKNEVNQLLVKSNTKPIYDV